MVPFFRVKFVDWPLRVLKSKINVVRVIVVPFRNELKKLPIEVVKKGKKSQLCCLRIIHFKLTMNM